MTLKPLRDPRREDRLRFTQRVRLWFRWIGLSLSSTKLSHALGFNFGVPDDVRDAYKEMASGRAKGYDYDPDQVVDSFQAPVMNRMIAFHEALMAEGDRSKVRPDNPFIGQKLSVREAWVFEGMVDEHGKMLKDKNIRESLGVEWPREYRIRHVNNDGDYRKLVKEATQTHKRQPERAKKARESVNARWNAYKKLREDGFILGADVPDTLFNQSFDPNQYTEYAPLMGGPYFRQLYMYDFLRQVAYAFEAWNHNPVGKAIIRILTQYALGRRFDVQILDEQKERVWNDYQQRTRYIRNVCTFWGKEAEIYGDFIYDWTTGCSVDPSTVWDIITDPDYINDEYYYYQSYPTAYQMFTGFQVKGEPDAEKQKATDYIVRQIPAWKLIHDKINCVSNEKRGRSSLFSVLGWLKRVKDLYNAKVIREWLYSCFMWDVTVKGNQADVDAYISANSAMPLPGSKHVHNEQVEMKPLPAIDSSGSRGGASTGTEIMCFLAVAAGIPKEFLNVVISGGGSRANSLTSAEPFTKAVEDIQARWEWITTETFKRVIENAGLTYTEGDIEVTFPSVTKDTTTETLKNIAMAEEMEWIDPRTAGTMAAKELNITQYDWDETQEEIQKLKRAGVTVPQMAPATGRLGNSGPSDSNGHGEDSEIHGDGKVDLQDEMRTL